MNQYTTTHGGLPNYPPPTFEVGDQEVPGQWIEVTRMDAPIVNGKQERTFLAIPPSPVLNRTQYLAPNAVHVVRVNPQCRVTAGAAQQIVQSLNKAGKANNITFLVMDDLLRIDTYSVRQALGLARILLTAARTKLFPGPAMNFVNQAISATGGALNRAHEPCQHEWNEAPIDELQTRPFCLRCGAIKP